MSKGVFKILSTNKKLIAKNLNPKNTTSSDVVSSFLIFLIKTFLKTILINF